MEEPFYDSNVLNTRFIDGALVIMINRKTKLETSLLENLLGEVYRASYMSNVTEYNRCHLQI